MKYQFLLDQTKKFLPKITGNYIIFGTVITVNYGQLITASNTK